MAIQNIISMEIHWAQVRRTAWNMGTRFEKQMISYEARIEGVEIKKETLISEGKPDTGYYIKGDGREYKSEEELLAMLKVV